MQDVPSLNVTLRQIRAFITVARLGSFTRAAETLHISQPALTLTIQQLERSLGLNLFDRTTRRVLLTVEGEDFLPTAERLMADFELALTDVKAIAENKRGHVRVAAVFSVAISLLPQAVLAFSAAYPRINVHLIDDNSSGVRRRVRLRDVDIGFAAKDDDPELEFTLMFRDQIGLVARKDHVLLRGKGPLPWRHLAAHDFFGMTEDTGIHAAMASQRGLPDNIRTPRVTFAATPVLEAMLRRGDGVTALPALAFPEGQRDGLVFRPLTEPQIDRDVYLVTRKGRSLGRAAQALLDCCKDEIRLMGERVPGIVAAPAVQRSPDGGTNGAGRQRAVSGRKAVEKSGADASRARQR
jgi:DNA-binding transcriptional LysR family regulator